ncbi:MAG: hypothetical protein NTW03_16745, partial [Verrucomicrobia bacterium]|nr:hypothetical protein [Verrucomicrobiota bacterium]
SVFLPVGRGPSRGGVAAFLSECRISWHTCGWLLLFIGLARVSPATSADAFFYLPPRLADRVVFYHSFAKGLKSPDLNLIGARLTLAENEPVPGLAGAGYTAGSGLAAQKKGAFVLQSPALSVHKPLTVMFWWRLDEPMKEETGFGLLALRGKGWISIFVAGKGPWCALKEPTYVFQCYNFPGMENCNDVWGGRAWFASGAFHLAAMAGCPAVVVLSAKTGSIYWDGQLRTRHAPKGRLFKEGETGSVELGPSGNGPAMTLDELVVLDRVLSGEEIQAYITAVKALAQVKFLMGQAAIYQKP